MCVEGGGGDISSLANRASAAEMFCQTILLFLVEAPASESLWAWAAICCQ